MPRRIFTITSKEDSNKKIELNSLSYELALEESLYVLNYLDCISSQQNIQDRDEHSICVNMVIMEQTLNELGWIISEDWDEPYKSMLYQDEHMMSLWNQSSEYDRDLWSIKSKNNL